MWDSAFPGSEQIDEKIAKLEGSELTSAEVEAEFDDIIGKMTPEQIEVYRLKAEIALLHEEDARLEKEKRKLKTTPKTRARAVPLASPVSPADSELAARFKLRADRAAAEAARADTKFVDQRRS